MTTIIKMPHDSYKHPQRIPPSAVGAVADKVVLDATHGTLVYYKFGNKLDKFPVKGRLLDGELLLDMDTTKKFAKGFIRCISIRPLKEFFYVLSEICTQRLAPHFLDQKYYDTATREIMRAGFIGFGGIQTRGTDIGTNLVESLGCILNADRPYRYRLQDVLQELNKKNWVPYEAYRLFKILKQRDHQRDWRGFPTLIFVYLLFGRTVRRRARSFFDALDISKVNYDEADLYSWLQNDSGDMAYDVMGMNRDERQQLWQKINEQEV